MYTPNEKEMAAAKKVLEVLNLEDTSEENVKENIEHDYLAFHEINGVMYCSYLDADGNELTVNVETLEEVNAEEVGIY